MPADPAGILGYEPAEICWSTHPSWALFVAAGLVGALLCSARVDVVAAVCEFAFLCFLLLLRICCVIYSSLFLGIVDVWKKEKGCFSHCL